MIKDLGGKFEAFDAILSLVMEAWLIKFIIIMLNKTFCDIDPPIWVFFSRDITQRHIS